MENGHTFFIDKILQDPFKSVYTTMQEQPKFGKFFALLAGDEDVMADIHADKKNPDIVSIFGNQAGRQVDRRGHDRVYVPELPLYGACSY